MNCADCGRPLSAEIGYVPMSREGRVVRVCRKCRYMREVVWQLVRDCTDPKCLMDGPCVCLEQYVSDYDNLTIAAEIAS